MTPPKRPPYTAHIPRKVLKLSWKLDECKPLLAGSERQKSTESAGVRLKEASAINKSLSALGNVIKVGSRAREP